MSDNQALLQGAVAMSTISVALLIVFLIVFLNPDLAASIQGRVRGAAGEAATSPTGKILVGALGAFAPDMAILTGFVSDILNVQLRHSVLSFTAIGSVVLNRFLFGSGAASLEGVATTMATEEPDIIGHTGGALPSFFVDNYNPCAIRGLAFLDTSKSPMGFAALTTIFTTILLDMGINKKRTLPEIGGNIAFCVVVLTLNVLSYGIFNCYGSNLQERGIALAKALGVGGVVGLLAFVIMQYAPNGAQYLPIDASPASLSAPSAPSGVGPGGQQACPPGQISVNGQCVPAPSHSATCSAPNDGDQFVCDAYKNGKLIGTTFSS